MKKTIFSFLFISLFIFVLTGCNLPGQATQVVEQNPDVIYTAAAETISARLAQTDAAAPVQPDEPVEQEQDDQQPPPAPSDTPIPPVEVTPTPSETPQPTLTNTPEPTLTPTLTGTASPTANPEAIFTDDFSDDTGWYTYEDDDWGFYYKDESYHIYNNLLGAAIWSVRSQEYNRVGLEVDGTRVAGPGDGYYGVVCRFGDDGENYYALVVGDDGFYGIALMEDGEFEFLAEGYDDADVINRGKGATNRVRGDCIGDRLVVYANGHQLLETRDDTLKKGDIGLVAGNKVSGDGIDVRFDNFAILQP